jgi:tRNA-dihydrouridine synthase B
VKIPVVLNGNVLTAHDVKKAFDETGADGVMIARGAIGNPWIFEDAKQLLTHGYISTLVDPAKRIKTTLRHLQLAVNVKGEKRAVLEHRKFYSGYLKGLYNASQIRSRMMAITEYKSVEDILLKYLEDLSEYKIAV